MRVATVDGLVTLFYDGSKELFNSQLEREWENEFAEYGQIDFGNWESWDLSNDCKQYLRERSSWEQIIVVEGVTMIPIFTFYNCANIQRVILSNTVIRVQYYAFKCCKSLVYMKLSINLEQIDDCAFEGCNLASVFLPPRCRFVGGWAFGHNHNLNIVSVAQDTEIGSGAFFRVKFLGKFPFHHSLYEWPQYYEHYEEIHTWMKNINNHEDYALHRACSSYQPLKEVIMSIIENKGIRAFKTENSIGITPSEYLKENPYTEVTEQDIIHDYLMKMMGEVV
ncbi:hypothetical protein CTEN210_00525 [Chaetoceros tenuissimus]|uniref:Leucine-rich repeat domain-containing protein n=1 Tax=Chaetoceros tenuissimus TaxID=426638 RepID=A0AAD3CE01_9STRA|nr:hypothetical protein CTEN210_00525 [Chaetoceros tenuissimus]